MVELLVFLNKVYDVSLERSFQERSIRLVDMVLAESPAGAAGPEEACLWQP